MTIEPSTKVGRVLVVWGLRREQSEFSLCPEYHITVFVVMRLHCILNYKAVSVA